jgi:hypothetical protein
MIDSTKVMSDIDEGQAELEGKEVVEKIFIIKEKLEEVPVNEWQMDALVDYVFTLCKIMPNLSDMKDYAYIHAQALSEEYKTAVRDEYIKLKDSGVAKTDTMAKSMAEQKCDDIKAKELKADYQARWLRSLHSDCERIVSFSQTKVKSLVDDKIRTNIPNN